MTSKSSRVITDWAVIIGINYYPGTNDRELEGCINDAKSMELYFKEAMGEALHVVVLTASTPSIHGDPPPEDTNAWPTYERVMSNLTKIIDGAQRGDRVYVHYSGHGTRVSDKCALVLLECDGRELRYLRLGVLVRQLEKMVEKGLRVTLVLDCCFSGGMIRSHNHSDFNIRFLDYDTLAHIDPTHEPDVTSPYDSNTLRDASIDAWPVDPKGYMVLAACAPEENAFEIEIAGTKRGVLTYFLHDTLIKMPTKGVNITHNSMHEHLSTSIHAHWPRQTPMRHGKSGFTLFGDSLLAPIGMSVPIYRDKEGNLHLQAGEIHGVFEGDEYAAYPSGEPEQARHWEKRASNVRVTAARAFESDLEEIDKSWVGKIQTGWKAKAMTSISPRVVQIGLLASNTNICQSISTERLRYTRLIDRRDNENQTRDSCMYNVSISEKNEYEIVDALLERVPSIPVIPCNSDGALRVLANILQHIAEFKYFEGVENRTPCQDFQNMFAIDSKSPPGISNRISIKHGDKWTATLKNKSTQQLYVGIFNLRPSWEVAPLTPASGFFTIPPRAAEVDGERPISIQMKVPEFLQNEGKTHCEDIFRIFVTSKATHFRMALPDIFHTASGRHNSFRGENNLTLFLSGLTDSFRSQSESKWATQNFFIQTSMG